jgi:hypothetical protein
MKAALFFGQGGIITSPGIWQLANWIRKLGIDAQCFDYTQVAAADTFGPELLYGYSLGVTSITFLQTMKPYQLVFAIAASEGAGRNNYPIHKKNTHRAVLWSGPGWLSDADTGGGWDQVSYSRWPHLMIQFAPAVRASALKEAQALL